MKEFMRRNAGESLAGADIDRRAVGMFHPAARPLRRFSDVENEKVMIERSAAHQLNLVGANLAQHRGEVSLFPIVAMNNDGDWMRLLSDFEEPKAAYFDGTIGEGVVLGSKNCVGDIGP